MSKETKKVSKGAIAVAWLLLIVLIFAAGGLTYLKFFSATGELENGDATSGKQTSPVILEALNTIVDNFNTNKETTESKKQNIEIDAKSEGTTIKVTYKEKTYDFKLTIPDLIIKYLQ